MCVWYGVRVGLACGGMEGEGGGGCAAREPTSPPAATPKLHTNPGVRRDIKEDPAAWQFCWWRRW
jgi:hypothetical protein